MATVCVHPDDFTQDTDGRLMLKAGCGLKRTTDGLAADVADWDYTCSQETNASRIFCDPTTGQLQGEPRDRSFAITDAQVSSENDVIQVGETSPFIINVDVDLSNWCEPGIMNVGVACLWAVQQAAGGDFHVTLRRQIDGDGFVTLFPQFYRDFNTRQRTLQNTATLPEVVGSLAPGIAHVIQYRMEITNEGPGAITVIDRSIRVRGIVTIHNP